MTQSWLHVLRTERNSQSFTVALSRTPRDKASLGSPLPTRKFDSWEQLSIALLAAGVAQSDLDDAQNTLKGAGFHTFADIILTEEERTALGFGSRSGSAG